MVYKKISWIFVSFYFLFLTSQGFAVLGEDHSTDPIELLGFTKLHQKGITGSGLTISFTETVRGSDAKYLPEELQDRRDSNQLEVIDCSNNGYCRPGCQDQASYRYPVKNTDLFIQDYCGELREQPIVSTYEDHANQTTALGLGTKGAAPKANGLVINIGCLYDYNLLDYTEYFRAGAALYSFSQLLFKTKREYERKLELIESQSLELKSLLKEKPIDGSIMSAIEYATKTPKCILNFSSSFTEFCDPFDDNLRVPQTTLDTIANLLDNSDSLLVIAACNKQCERRTTLQNAYLRSFAQHERLKKRLLITLNLEEDPLDPEAVNSHRWRTPELKPVQVTLPNGSKTFMGLHSTSNFPLSHGWEECAIGALGSNICFPDGAYGSGTSLAAPLVSGLCTLVRQTYPALSGPEVIQYIKDTAISLGAKGAWGYGLIDPIKACGF